MKKLPQDIKNIKKDNTNNPYGLSHRKIAEQLGLTRGKVWHIEEQALKKIRTFIINNNLSPILLEYFE
ncbi:sigma factor-like helix-turn-helix DNA-binding protein [Aliarcobacter butzleri]|uniref:sigma factor-like helix-turn-helix DNA-binding protein n=1 Tax=Aliarcobacter butzleri TaxID=28197 RepID=UPI001EDB960F|nr:sigma factor-like helix-turn-helix DNA-binding protein [Aliarcobacter butzleri]MCG3686494.1 hypothetical protein [Aliarcobacter butzleri]